MSRQNADHAFRQRRPSGWHRCSRWTGWPLSLLLVTSGLAIALPVQAHKVKLDADVGGTLHIEPNDVPKAGASSLIWFALTRKGGEVIPLSNCDCRFRVYADTATEGASPIAEPALKAVSAEGYTAIPGADYVFPDVGAYTLVVEGSPTGSAEFTPFELAFEVTVAARASGQEVAPPSTDPAEPSATATSDSAVDDASPPIPSTENEPSVETEPAAADSAPGFWRSPVLLASVGGGLVLLLGVLVQRMRRLK